MTDTHPSPQHCDYHTIKNRVFDELCSLRGQLTETERIEIAWITTTNLAGIPDWAHPIPHAVMEALVFLGDTAGNHGALRSIVDDTYAAAATGLALALHEALH